MLGGWLAGWLAGWLGVNLNIVIALASLEPIKKWPLMQKFNCYEEKYKPSESLLFVQYKIVGVDNKLENLVENCYC